VSSFAQLNVFDWTYLRMDLFVRFADLDCGAMADV
jgi:hypothetical protein